MVYLLIAVMLVLITSIVISANDGLLRTNTGFIDPSSSLTLYVDWLKYTVATKW